MSFKQKTNLSSKFLPPILGVTMVALFIGAYLIFTDVKTSTSHFIDNARSALNTEQKNAKITLLQALKSKSDLLGQFMAKIAPELILGFDFVSLTDYQEQASSDPDVAYAVFLDPERQAYTETTKPKDISTIIESEYAIVDDGDNLGYVIVGMSKKFVNQSVVESHQRIESAINDVSLQGTATLERFKVVGSINALVLILAITVSLIALFKIFVTRPLQQLQDSAYQVSHGNLNFEIDETRNDELGSLAKSFSEMRDSIKKKMADLGDLNSVGEELTGLHNQREVLITSLKVMCKQTQSVRGSVFLYDETTKQLEVKTHYPQLADVSSKSTGGFSIGEEIARKTVDSREAIFISNTHEDNLIHSACSENEALSIVSIPMFDNDKIFGVMNFYGEVGQAKFDQPTAEFAETIARMTVVTFKNIEMLKVIEEYSRTLEQKIEERTAELRKKTNDINNMLQNMHQGIFTICFGNKVHPEYSIYLETILDTKNIADQDVMKLLFSNSDLGVNAIDQIYATLGALIDEDMMMFDFNSHLLVNEIQRQAPDGQTKILEVDWDPIASEDDIIEKIMVTVRDVTEMRQLQAEAEQQKWELDVIGQILAVPVDKFLKFINGAYDFIDENKITIEQNTSIESDVVASLFRNMHTIKGNSRTFGFNAITDAVHQAENTYDEMRKGVVEIWSQEQLLDELAASRALIETYERIYKEKLARGNEAMNVDLVVIEKAQKILDGFDKHDEVSAVNAIEDIKQIFDAYNSESLQSILQGILTSLPSIAKQLGKENPEVFIDDADLYFNELAAGTLKEIFTHGFRNCIDHGIETASERQAVGKPERGNITLKIDKLPEKIVMHFYDDGLGLNLEKLKQKAIENNIFTVAELPDDKKIAETIFHSGISTATHVSDVSGRGVGLDAVRNFLQKIGGNVEVEWQEKKSHDSQYRLFEICITLPIDVVIPV